MSNTTNATFLTQLNLFSHLSRASRLALSSVIALSITACGGGGGGGGEVIRTPDYKPTYGVGEGESAKMETVSQVSPISTYFGKRYNRPNLEGVLRASGVETVKYVRALTVSPYRVSVSDDDPYFSMLSPVTKDLRKIWDQASGGVSGGTLAGLYFDACGYVQCDRDSFQPTILVANTSTRWVIVHEMMHHLFNVQRKRDGTLNSGAAADLLQTSINNVSDALDQFKEYNDRFYLLKAANEFKNVLTYAKLALASHQLEEATVERVLVDEWAADRFVYVDTELAANAVWYMTSNAKLANDFDARLNQTMTEIVTITDDANALDAKAVMLQNIADLQAFDQSIVQTVTDAANTVKAKIEKLPSNPANKKLVKQLSHPFTAGVKLAKTSCLEDHHELENAARALDKIAVR